jgi:flagellar FliL protein
LIDKWRIVQIMKDLRIQSAADAGAYAGQEKTALGSRFKRKPMRIILAIVLLAVSIVCGVFLYNGRLRGQAAENVKNPQLYRPGPIYSFEPFVVNIAETNATRYLRVGVSVECGSKRAHARIAQNELRIRDRILDLLCAQSIEELLDVSGRDNLREEMAVKIREALGDKEDSADRITSVYFSEFTIQ